jgi:hypothetical protein
MTIVTLFIGEIFTAFTATAAEVVCRLAWKIWANSCTIPASCLTAYGMLFWITVWLLATETIWSAKNVVFLSNAIEMLVMKVEQNGCVIIIRSIAVHWSVMPANYGL